MLKWLCFGVFFAIFCVVLYFLYRQGFAVSKCIRAIVFVFRPGKASSQVTLDSCTGWVRYVGQFREQRIYAFRLDAQLSRGDAEVLLLDRNKQPLLKLNRQSPAGQIELDGTSRYYLHWAFQGATGRCELHW